MNKADRETQMALVIGVLSGTLMYIRGTQQISQPATERINDCLAMVQPLIEELFYRKETTKTIELKRRIQT